MPGPVAAAAHAFVADLEHPELIDVDRHHLERALRLRPGAVITVCDGKGRWRCARMGPVLEPDGEVVMSERVQPSITMAMAPGKGERPDWAVQKMTELGVDRVVVFTAGRSVVRWNSYRAGTHLERLRRIVREASMQSRRVWLPVVEEPTTFAALIGRPGVVMAAPGGQPPSLDRSVVLIGPEGGWTAGELETDVPSMALAPHILRSETAAVTAVALLAALRAQLVQPA